MLLAALGAASLFGCALVVVLLRSARSRRTLRAQLASCDAAVGAAVARADEAVSELNRWRVAVDHLGVGVVIFDHTSAPVHANALAAEFTEAHDARALVSRAVNAVAKAAAQHQLDVRTVELTGPPAQVFHVAGYPVFGTDTPDEPDAPDALVRQPLGAVVVIEDHTQAAAVERSHSDFVANMSHELRTPLSAVGLLAETAAGEHDPATRARLVDRVGAEVDRVGALIDDLLELSRVEVEGTGHVEAVDLRALVDQVIGQFAHHANRAQVKLRHVDARVTGNAAAARGAALVGDRTQLLRAVGNLVDNAIKYSAAGSTVTLSVNNTADTVQLSVADEGIGIDAENHQRVFERFYRVDRSHSRATGGTGLGLSIVKQVVDNHGGQITLESEEGVGSVFRLTFPAGDVASAPAPASAPSTAAPSAIQATTPAAAVSVGS